MAVTFYDLSSAAGLKKLDDYLLSRSYISGFQASKDDLVVHAALSKTPSSDYVNVSRWFNHIEALLRISGVSGEGSGVTIEGSAPAVATPPAADTKASAAEDDDDDDDVDLFGEETEEEKKASEERAAAVKASGKKKESGKSSVLMDIKPWDDETDMKKLEEAVRSVEMEGLFWGASKLVAVGYGIKKLQIMLTIIDDLVSVDTLIEDHLTAEPINEYVQSCDIVAFNKIFGEERAMVVEEDETPRSPEAKLGMQVEDLWDVQEPQLSPTEKLNACFESIPVSSFPHAPSSQVIEIRSDTSLAEAVKLLARHKVLGAPVVDVNAPEDASWIDRYIGVVEFAGIVVWTLHQSEKMEAHPSFDSAFNVWEDDIGPAVAAAAASGMSSPRFRSMHPDSPTATCGRFFETLTSSELYKNTKVGDISGSFRWAPFLALQKSNSFLTMLLLLSKYRMKSVPVVDLGEVKIDNIITQSAVIHMLEECAGLHWFESWGSKKLFELGLPLMKASHIVKVSEDEPVLQAFKIMRQNGVGGVPVVASDGSKAVGNISIRDIQFLLMAPEIYKNFRSITTKDFLTTVRGYLEKTHKDSPLLSGMVTCQRNDTLKQAITKLDSMKIHRIYVVDETGNLEGVITLRDIISKLVHEPRGYFGDFFDGVLPLPADSRV